MGLKSMKGWVSVCFFLYPSRHTDTAQYGNPRRGQDVKLKHHLRWTISEGPV